MNAPFSWSEEREPHVERRRQMLQKHPQIKALYGPCWRTKYVCSALVAAQLLLAFLLRDAPWWLILLVAYGVGGVINQALLLAIHELSHNLAFRKPWHNRVFAMFVNLPIGVPVAETFRYYHLLHHTHQGDERLDTDLPTNFEGRLLRGRFSKLLWLSMQGLAYALRPLFVHPKKPSAAELVNLLLQIAFNVAVFYFLGGKALAYLPISSLIVMGLHPIAGHYISEHYVFRAGQETYSYYGPLNALAFNVGYHNEHHDFPYIAGSRLPELCRLAPEFYDPLLSHSSWTKTLWQFVTEPTIGGYSRIKRRRSCEVPSLAAPSADSHPA
ncbi:MAG TPA: fatty acid desaturase [Polyangiaceae bacterium]|nr:fatty acid desaturase [Polyangiaceae bacterium]